jgi:hypothetical protein
MTSSLPLLLLVLIAQSALADLYDVLSPELVSYTLLLCSLASLLSPREPPSPPPPAAPAALLRVLVLALRPAVPDGVASYDCSAGR